MPPRSRPVPWVPVWMAPATVCSWMSPMFCRASPWLRRYSLSTRSGQPAATVTCPAAASTDAHRAQAVRPEQHPVGHRDRGERVAGPGHPHGQPVPGGPGDRLGHLLGGPGGEHAARRRGLVAGPVLPAGCCGDHARTLPAGHGAAAGSATSKGASYRKAVVRSLFRPPRRADFQPGGPAYMVDHAMRRLLRRQTPTEPLDRPRDGSWRWVGHSSCWDRDSADLSRADRPAARCGQPVAAGRARRARAARSTRSSCPTCW